MTMADPQRRRPDPDVESLISDVEMESPHETRTDTTREEAPPMVDRASITEKKSGNLGIDSAYRVVKDLLDQITLNDSPPINDEVQVAPAHESGFHFHHKKSSPSSATASVTTKSTEEHPNNREITSAPHSPQQQHRVSRQQHAYGSSGNSPTISPTTSNQETITSLDNASTLSSIASENTAPRNMEGMPADTATLWMAQYNKSQTRAEMKMGNVALATLCIRTLDSVDASKVLPSDDELCLDGPSPSLERTDEDAPPEPSHTKATTTTTSKQSLRIVTDPQELNNKPKSKKISPKSWIKRDPPSSSGRHSPSKSWRMPWKKKHAPSPPGKIASEQDDLPPTPVRGNRKAQVQSRDPSPGTFPSSPDSTDAVLTPDNEDSESRLGEGTALHFESDVEESPMHDDDEEEEDHELFGPEHSADMEDITEETEDDIAEEQGVHRNKKVVPGQSTVKVSTKSHNAPLHPPTSPRFQMFGSEYARFLSSTPLAPPTSTKNKRKSSRHSRARDSRTTSTAASKRLSLAGRPLNIEDANDAALTGAITDIVVTHGSQLPPKGYYRISQTGEGDEFTALKRSAHHGGGLIPGRRSTQVFINVKKEPSWDRAAQRPCVTALAVIFPNRKEFVPPGFCVVRRYKSRNGEKVSTTDTSNAADLNFGSSGERVYLCYRRSREGNPITGIIPLQPLNHETIPEGYTVMERTPRNHVADINTNAGAPVFLAFRQRLASLEPLRPLPLVLSVHSANPFDAMEDDGTATSRHKRARRASRKKRLRAYYCTGGTVVHSEVGRFHIMDRSTHSLLSPSSISHRMGLIEASRQRAGNSGSDISRTHTYASSIDSVHTGSDFGKEDLASNEANEGSNDVNRSLRLSDISLDETPSALLQLTSHSSLNKSFSTLSVGSQHGEDSSHGSYQSGSAASARYSFSAANVVNQTLFSSSDTELQRCLEILSFIPVVETAYDTWLVDEDERIKLQARIAVLTPILTSCYTNHGGSALLAVKGLTTLLKTTEFFSPDVPLLSDPTNGASARLTLLDLATQAVCDVATSTSRETSFGECVDFVQRAVQYSQGQLNTRTIGYVLRFYLFVFYFGASVPTSSKGPNPVWTSSSREQRDSRAERSIVALHDLPMLYEEPMSSDQKQNRYLPGGAPQAAALALKELISLTIERLSCMSALDLKAFSKSTQDMSSSEPFGAFIQGIMSSLVDGAIHRVDVAKYTQLANHQIHRSGGSELFWYDMMNSCGTGLFSSAGFLPNELKTGHIVSFAILANIVKVACGKLRRVPHNNELVPRDVASKLLSLELINHFVERWHDGERHMRANRDSSSHDVVPAVDTMAFAIRRLVVPCLLSSTEGGLEDNRVFRRMIRIVSALWRSPYYRRHMKMEIGVMVDHFALGILRLGPQIFPPGRMSALEGKSQHGGSSSTVNGLKAPLLSQQIDLLFEVRRWFDSNGCDAVEFFLNFDTNMWTHESVMGQMLPGTQWRLCQQLCGAICTIAEQAGDLLCQQIRASKVSNTAPPPSPSAATSAVFFSSQMPADSSEGDLDQTMLLREGSRHLQRAAFEAITQILKNLALSAATAMGMQYFALVSSWEEDDESEVTPQNDVSPQIDYALSGSISSSSPAETTGFVGSASPGSKNWRLSTPRKRDETSRGDVLPDKAEGDEGIVGYWQSAIAAERRKAAASPKHPPHHKTTLSDSKPKATSPGKSGSASESTTTRATHPGTEELLPIAFEIASTKSLKKAVDYLIACDFLTPAPRDVAAFLRLHRSQLEPAPLGVYLGEGGNGGGEVDYWNQIRFYYFRPISFVGMNVEQGLRHFLTNCGFRLPGEAQQIDRIMTTFAQCYWEDNAGDMSKCPFKDQDTVFLIAFAIIMLNTDLHKTHGHPTASSRKQRKKMTKSEFLNNLRGVDTNEDLSREYLSEVYDSIEAHPIALLIANGELGVSESLHAASTDTTDEDMGLDASLKAMLKQAKSREELLRGVSVHEHPFYTVDDFSKSLSYDGSTRDAMVDVARSVIATSWHHFHGLIHSVLDAAHLDPRGMEWSLDLLQYALCTTICLDMTMERAAFMTQLARFKTFRERRGNWRSTQEIQTYKLADWYIKMESNCADPTDDNAKLAALADVHSLIDELHESLRIDVNAKREMSCVVRRIRSGDFLLNDPTRFFLREGDLHKRGNRLGRTTKYRFFLFSDVLIYAKASGGDACFKIHEELPLHLMKITDWFPDKRQQMKTAFQIHHPRKTFIVFCDTVEERQGWVRDVRKAIEKEVERLTHLENARLAAASVGGER